MEGEISCEIALRSARERDVTRLTHHTARRTDITNVSANDTRVWSGE